MKMNVSTSSRKNNCNTLTDTSIQLILDDVTESSGICYYIFVAYYYIDKITINYFILLAFTKYNGGDILCSYCQHISWKDHKQDVLSKQSPASLPFPPVFSLHTIPEPYWEIKVRIYKPFYETSGFGATKPQTRWRRDGLTNYNIANLGLFMKFVYKSQKIIPAFFMHLLHDGSLQCLCVEGPTTIHTNSLV